MPKQQAIDIATNSIDIDLIGASDGRRLSLASPSWRLLCDDEVCRLCVSAPALVLCALHASFDAFALRLR
ncbi:hypothetical protein Aduo_004861 [Ancylostoma duodenale]